MSAATIKSGLVERLNRPGGNVTGISVFSGSQLGTKHIGLLHELVPAATVIALLVNPTNSAQTETQTKLVEPAARALGVRLHVVNASNESDFSTAFARDQAGRVGFRQIELRGVLEERRLVVAVTEDPE